MNKAFNIQPQTSENNSLHLLVEAGSYGISLIWFTKMPFAVKGLAMYNAPELYSPEDIKSIFGLFDKFLTGLASTTICYDFKESILLPGRYNNTVVAEESLRLFYGDSNETVMNNDLITSAYIYNHYRIPKQLEPFFSKQFRGADVFHSTSLQLEYLKQPGELLYCIVFHNIIKIILYKEGKLQIVQQFSYSSPVDAAYFLLNVCEQHDMKSPDLHLRLSGMIDEHSTLYAELLQYFSKMSFETIPADIQTPGEVKNLPAHYFSHLTALALCVS